MNGPTVYRLLTGDDTSEFCHKVSAALAAGWELYGGPAYSYDHANGVMRCAQAVIKALDTPYAPEMSLGEQ